MGFFDLFSDKNEKRAAQAQKQGLVRGRDEAFKYIDQGQTGFDQYAGRAYDEFGTYDTMGRSGATTYADALGIGQPGGQNSAVSAFQATPGYDFMRDEALRAVERSASAGGQLGSGNALAAVADRASGLANQEYSSWLDRLKGVTDMGVGVAGARSGVLSGQGAQAYNTGATKAQVGWNAETGMGQADAEFQKSKDQSGLNMFNAVKGLLELGMGY